MEPITTLLLYGALLAPAISTSAPRWSADTGVTARRVVAERTTYLSPLWVSLETGSAVYTFSPNQFPSQINRIISTLESYRTLGYGWGGEESLVPNGASIDAAIQFVRSMPAGIELPSPMISYEGQIGLYWSSTVGYVSLDFENNGHASLYSRNRQVDSDYFVDDIKLSECNQSWYEEALSTLNSSSLNTAA
jgi:hypothetical protein